jgi:hypothetical protein
METDAASAGVEYRCSEEVIEIHQHGEHEYQVGSEPVRFINEIGYEYREDDV